MDHGLKINIWYNYNSYELGIPTNQIRRDYFHYWTRMHYSNTEDGTWGEHEINYILFLQKYIDFKLNINVVSEVRYIKRAHIDDKIE